MYPQIFLLVQFQCICKTQPRSLVVRMERPVIYTSLRQLRVSAVGPFIVVCSVPWPSGLEVNFLAHLQSFASKNFFHWPTGKTTSKFFPFVWETWMILTRKRLLMDIFLTRRLSKSLAFCEFASVSFEPWPLDRSEAEVVFQRFLLFTC